MPGPYVQAAAFCEKTLQEVDGTFSLIRVVDRMTASVRGAEAPTELPAVPINVTFVIMLKSGDAKGRHPVTIGIQMPDTRRLPDQTVDVMFEGEERGVTLILNLQLEAMEGIYWFDVRCNNHELTRAPLRVIYQRIPGSA